VALSFFAILQPDDRDLKLSGCTIREIVSRGLGARGLPVKARPIEAFVERAS
jgi:hypothetical protein